MSAHFSTEVTVSEAQMAEIREYVAFSVREQMLKHPGKKGERTYAEILHLMTEDGQYSYSNYLDDDLEKITSNFRKEVGCTQDSFSFADSNTVLKFPAEVAASMPEEKVLRQPSELNALEKTALKSNALLMGNLAQPQSTQDFVSAAIVLLKEDMVVYGDEPRKFKMVSFPDPMAYTRKSFGDRSPDLPFLSHPNTTSPHCITFMLDVKPAKEGEYTDEEIGHIVDMARELLNTVQMARRGIICGLTDGSRFQFFRVMRLEAPEIYVEASRIFTDMQGWEVLIALIALPLEDEFMMRKEHRVAGLKLHSILGQGSRSAVYEVRCVVEEAGEGKSPCESFSLPPFSYCKVYAKPPADAYGRDEGCQCFDRERAALRRLQYVPNIPKIFLETTVMEEEQVGKGGAAVENVVVLSPVGLPLWPVSTRKQGLVIIGRHFAQLVTTVEEMHSAGVLHRDIKPANVFLQQDTDLLLLADFDAAVVLQEDKPLQFPTSTSALLQGRVQTRRARGTSVEPVGSVTLENLTLETPPPKTWKLDQQFVWVGTDGYSDSFRTSSGLHTPTPEHDLVALVRTVYSLVRKMQPMDSDEDCDAFWARCMPPSSMWCKFLQMARDRQYGALRAALGRL